MSQIFSINLKQVEKQQKKNPFEWRARNNGVQLAIQ